MARPHFLGPSLSLSLVLALAAGCGGEENSSPSIDTLPEGFAEAASVAVAECFGEGVSLITGGEDLKANVTRTIEDMIAAIGPSLDAGRVDYDGSKLEACLAAIRGAGCDFTDSLAEEKCEAALDGTVGLGDPCDFSMECDGPAYCKSSGTCPGTCTAAEPAGGTCTTDSDCDRGLQCDEKQRECFKPSGTGGRCGGGVAPDCEFGLLCLGEDENEQRTGTCALITEVLSAGSGASCNPVLGPYCAPDLHCKIDSVTDVIVAACTARAGRGAACGVAIPDMCPVDQYCAVPQNALAGTCTDRPAAGSPCAAGPFGDPPNICAPNTRCDEGTCRTQQEIGSSCASSEACLSEYCLDGKCALDGSCG